MPRKDGPLRDWSGRARVTPRFVWARGRIEAPMNDRILMPLIFIVTAVVVLLWSLKTRASFAMSWPIYWAMLLAGLVILEGVTYPFNNPWPYNNPSASVEMALGMVLWGWFCAFVFLWLPAVLIYYGIRQGSMVGLGMVISGIVPVGFLMLLVLAGPV